MIQSDVSKCKDLKSFYQKIRKDQEEAHGKTYCSHHDAIQKYMSPGDTYKEFGVHQGASAAAACFVNPKKMELVDITFNIFDPNKKHFEDYCLENNIELKLIKMSSIDPKTRSPVDVLMIDSVHKVPHLKEELRLHADNVRKYMIFHDTAKCRSLFNYLTEFVQNSKGQWGIIEIQDQDVGHTVLGRTQ